MTEAEGEAIANPNGPQNFSTHFFVLHARAPQRSLALVG
jgi:hypothetical protein